MLAWYDDINSLIDKTADERNAFVTRHKRSLSTGSARSISSDGGLEEDEADQVPFSAAQSVNQGVAPQSELPSRPSPGGRFPSDLQVDRSLQARGPSSGSSSEVGLDITTAAGGPQIAQSSYPNAYDDRTPMEAAYGSGNPYEYHPNSPPQPIQQQTSYYANNAPSTPGQSYANSGPTYPDQSAAQPTAQPILTETYQPPASTQSDSQQQYPTFGQNQRTVSNYGEWMAPATGAVGGAAAGALGAEALRRHQQNKEQEHEEAQINAALADPTPSGQTTHPASQIVSQHENAALVAPVAPLSLPTHEHEACATGPGREAFVGVPAPVMMTSLAADGTPTGARDLSLSTTTDGKVENGEHAVAHMGVRRQDTDFSVSDLHVPGEYPKTRVV